jgi:hypothetical protein
MADGPWLSEEEQKAWRSYTLMRRTLETHLARQMQHECGLSPSDFEILVNLSESEAGRMRAVELGAATQWECPLSGDRHNRSRLESDPDLCTTQRSPRPGTLRRGSRA